MKVVLGSKNKEKLDIVRKALEELHVETEVIAIEVESEVSNQPLDIETTKQGARNRAMNAKKMASDADFWIGLEGGLHDYGEGYYLVTYACLVDKNGNEYIGEGEEIQLPNEVSRRVKNGEWFGKVIREYAKDHEVDENLITRFSPFIKAVQGAYVEYLKTHGNLGYRKKVSGIITNNEGKYLIVQLVDYGENHWNWPGGGMERGEKPKETILRELGEELGTDKFTVIKTSSIINKYEWPNYVIAKRLKAEGKTWKGQEVIHIQLKFVGDNAEIKPDPGEIKQVKWIDYKELESHFVIPNQWNVAKEVINELAQ